MSDAERCRATAARYARLAGLSENAEQRRAYWDLQRLWLEMADVTESVGFSDDDGLRGRLDALLVRADAQRPATVH